MLGGGASDFEDAVSGRTRGRKSVDPLDTVSARGAALVTPAGLNHEESDIVPCLEFSSRRKPRLLDEKFAKSFNRLARYDFIPSLQQAWAVILPVARRQPRLHATARCRTPPVGLRAFLLRSQFRQTNTETSACLPGASVRRRLIHVRVALHEIVAIILLSSFMVVDQLAINRRLRGRRHVMAKCRVLLGSGFLSRLAAAILVLFMLLLFHSFAIQWRPPPSLAPTVVNGIDEPRQDACPHPKITPEASWFPSQLPLGWPLSEAPGPT